MKIICSLLLLLVPATGFARDHDLLASMGMVTLLAIGGVVWFICAAIFKAVFGKKSVESTATPPSADDIKPKAKPTMNIPPPVNLMHTITIKSSQQSMEEIEGRLYEQIAQEIEANAVDKGIWTKAFAQSGGDDKLTRVAYIKARFEKLMAAENAKLEAMQQEREEIAKPEREETERIGALRQRISLHELSASDSVKLKDLGVSDNSANFIARCSWGDLDFISNSIKENPLFVLVSNGSGSTGLHMAVKNKHVNAAKLLAEKGASVNVRNKDGKSPIDIANESGQTDLAMFFQQFNTCKA